MADRQADATGKRPPAAGTGTEEKPSKSGDFRGPYGYGRPAHRADPEARYGFRPQQRTLPPPRP